VPADRITLIRNGIRLDQYHPAGPDGNPELRRELGIPEDAPVVGAVGHLRPEKRFERILDA
jgi:glycosyltransferase involved in cell wall biosynthesis